MASGSGYENPFRSIKGLSPERIDMGVDYGGTGPVHALGPGTIVNVNNSGWPGGTFIAEKLSSGPDAGKFVYEAETANPQVHVGQDVTSSTITSFMNGPASIEIGWAAPPGSGAALGASQFSGANSTAYGKNMSDLLKSLGAPAGIVQAGGVRGSVPASFVSDAQPSSNSSGNPTTAAATNVLQDLLSGLGFTTDISDLLERAGLILLGAALLIIGVIKTTGQEKNIKAAATDVAMGGPENPEADAAALAVRNASS